MEAGLQLCIIILGLLVMVGIIPFKKIPAYLGVLILFFLFVPSLYLIGKQKALRYMAGPHQWWEFLILFVGILLLLRFILDIILPWRRKK